MLLQRPGMMLYVGSKTTIMWLFLDLMHPHTLFIHLNLFSLAHFLCLNLVISYLFSLILGILILTIPRVSIIVVL